MLFKKKKPEITPERLETKLVMAEAKLLKREAKLKDQREKGKEEAKECLKKGDERGFKLSSRKFANIQAQLNTVSGMIEMSSTMKYAVEQQRDMEEIVNIGSDLVEAQKLLGFDTQKVEEAVTGIRTAVEKVTTASDMLKTQTEMLTMTSPETSSEMEALRSELMAEISSDKAEEIELDEKIKKAEEA